MESNWPNKILPILDFPNVIWFGLFSGILNDFLDNVCGGHDEIAEVHPSLEFLGFGFLPELGAPGFVSSLTEASIKTEPQPFSYFEPETLYDETLNDDGLDFEDAVEEKRPRQRRQRQMVEDPNFSDEDKPIKDLK